MGIQVSRMNVPQLWQKWDMISAHTGAFDSSSFQGIGSPRGCKQHKAKLQVQTEVQVSEHLITGKTTCNSALQVLTARLEAFGA